MLTTKHAIQQQEIVKHLIVYLDGLDLPVIKSVRTGNLAMIVITNVIVSTIHHAVTSTAPAQ